MVQVAKQLAWYHQPDSDPSLAPTHSTLKVFQWGRRELQNPKKPTGDLPFLSGRCCQRQQCFNLSQTTAHTESSWRGRGGLCIFMTFTGHLIAIMCLINKQNCFYFLLTSSNQFHGLASCSVWLRGHRVPIQYTTSEDQRVNIALR